MNEIEKKSKWILLPTPKRGRPSKKDNIGNNPYWNTINVGNKRINCTTLEEVPDVIVND